jgi:hypothetical protein
MRPLLKSGEKEMFRFLRVVLAGVVGALILFVVFGCAIIATVMWQ